VLAFGGRKKDGGQRSFPFQGLVVLSLHVKICTCILRRLYEERQDISVQDPCLKRCPSPRETRPPKFAPLNFFMLKVTIQPSLIWICLAFCFHVTG